MSELIPGFSLTQRSPKEVIVNQVKAFSSHILKAPQTREILDSVFDIVLVTNNNHQAIFANKALSDFLKLKSVDSIYGLRPGEILGCVHANKKTGGCCTAEFCKTCGAFKAILASKQGNRDTQECHIVSKNAGRAFDLEIVTTPLYMENQQFSVFTFDDIRSRKHKAALEHTFFHDILNTSDLVGNLAAFLKEAPHNNTKEIAGKIFNLSRRLIGEIQAQRDILYAENNELVTQAKQISSLGVLKDVVDYYKEHGLAKNKKLKIDKASAAITFTSNPVLLNRIIGNMIKNALEASKRDDTITAGCRKINNNIEFWVNNPAFMPEEVQSRIFHRFFSTKGEGRGLGTYSMKLLSERYLKGTVTFASSKKAGTTFYARYPIS